VPDLPAPTALDDLPRRAALRAPDQDAFRAGGRTLTFAALDAAVDVLAAALRARIGSGTAVGVPAELSPDFAVAYYAVARSGNTVVTVNPFLRGEALAHLVTASGMALAFTADALAERFAALGDRAPLLAPLADAATALVASPAPEGGRTEPAPRPELDATVCVHFTSGTTGPAKGVRLSHRNLTANAAQVAVAHRLTGGAVVLNHLPTFHPMHLNSGVFAGVTQVLCPGDDTAAAIAAANAHGAVRFYTLPVRLARLADDPRLPGLRFETVEAVLSGGTALPPAPAQVLREHFGIPVTQGYGLAETSPLTHTERLDDPRPGSVGPAVPDTECRIVDLETRAELPPGQPGEVQVRGPQVMAGYLDPATPTGIDAEGWLRTGDVGYQDAEGVLYLVDRIKDVFKCDNWIVSPTEIERAAARHPAVLECVVVDHPHPHRGAVAHCFVVLREPADAERTAALLAEIRAVADADAPEHRHIHHITAVPAIPRSPNGKVARREVRAWTRPQPDPTGLPAPASTSKETAMVTLVNQLTVTGDQAAFEDVNARMSRFMSEQPGYLSHRLLHSLREPRVYVELAEWENPESHVAAVRSDTFQGFVRELAALVAKPVPGLYEDVKPGH